MDEYGHAYGSRTVPIDEKLAGVRLRLVKDKLDDFYDHIKRETGYDPGVIDPNNFIVGKDDQLYVKKGDGTAVRLTYKNNPGKFKSLSKAIRAWGLSKVF